MLNAEDKIDNAILIVNLTQQAMLIVSVYPITFRCHGPNVAFKHGVPDYDILR